METKREKAKWTKAYKRLKADKANSSDSDASEGEVSERKESQRKMAQEEQDVFNIDSSSSSSSSSLSDSDSEQDVGCKSEKYMLDNKQNKTKNCGATRNAKPKPHYNHIDGAINDTYLSSDLRKPTQIGASMGQHGQTLKKSKLKNLSPILFLKKKHSTGKKKRQTKSELVKAL
jgi:hypothetical protein